ncbi:hypothetical protein E2C01_035593 [Portunus trituberculatus]|uniref:Uncharacterized protein n=1 Tax=Portunus trituberculatus TaxID=210409 RepID=A0A5B7F698_PORTR|nr:hypothetical protein [Portunus trituberculatus]
MFTWAPADKAGGDAPAWATISYVKQEITPRRSITQQDKGDSDVCIFVDFCGARSLHGSDWTGVLLLDCGVSFPGPSLGRPVTQLYGPFFSRPFIP